MALRRHRANRIMIDYCVGYGLARHPSLEPGGKASGATASAGCRRRPGPQERKDTLWDSPWTAHGTCRPSFRSLRIIFLAPQEATACVRSDDAALLLDLRPYYSEMSGEVGRRWRDQGLADRGRCDSHGAVKADTSSRANA